MKGSNRRRVVAGAAAAAAVVGTGAAVGATQWSPQAENDAMLADVAEQLGVEPDELEGAIENALEDRLDEAVEAGRMTQEQADALKERIESGDFPLFGGGGGPGGPGGMHGGGRSGSTRRRPTSGCRTRSCGPSWRTVRRSPRSRASRASPWTVSSRRSSTRPRRISPTRSRPGG